MTTKLLNRVTAVGVSKAIQVPRQVAQHSVYTEFRSLAATKISAVTLKLQGSLVGPREYAPGGIESGISMNDDVLTGVITDPGIVIGSTPERVANVAFDYQINGISYSKGAVAAGSVFSAAHMVAAGTGKWGVVNIYINAAGLIITRVPGSSQTGSQSYASAALAHVAGDALNMPVPDVCYIGRILINADSSTWTANTDDLTNGSEVTTATFLSETTSFFDLATHVFSAPEIINQKAMWHRIEKNVEYVRHYLSTLTGTGKLSSYHYTGGVKRG